MTAKKKGAKKMTPPPELKDTGPVVLPLEELHMLRLTLLNKEVAEAQAAVAKPLQAEAEQALQQAIQAGLSGDAAYTKVNAARTVAINAVLDAVQEQLPPGYAVVKISPESSEIVAEFRPEASGKRLS